MLDILKERVKSVDSMKATLVDFYKTYCDDVAKVDGESWYRSAYYVAKGIAERHHFSIPQVAGVLSALSPSVLWETNILDAERLIQGYVSLDSVDKITVSTYERNKAKAFRILEGKPEAFNVEDQFTIGTKTHSFYWNILSPTGTMYVTVDRHAIGAVLDSKGTDHLRLSVTPKRYCDMSMAYCDAAHVLDILCPATLQATIWVAYRDNFGGRPTADVIEDAPF